MQAPAAPKWTSRYLPAFSSLWVRRFWIVHSAWSLWPSPGVLSPCPGVPASLPQQLSGKNGMLIHNICTNVTNTCCASYRQNNIKPHVISVPEPECTWCCLLRWVNVNLSGGASQGKGARTTLKRKWTQETGEFTLSSVSGKVKPCTKMTWNWKSLNAKSAQFC